MNRRVLTAVATCLPLAALSVAWLSNPADVRHGFVANEDRHMLVAATGAPRTCADDGVDGLCDDAHLDSTDGRERSGLRQREAARPSPSAPRQLDAAQQPSPADATSSPEPSAEQDGGEGTADGNGQTKRMRFTYGVDRKSWYWDRQRDQEVGAGPVAQRSRLPNPQRPDTLPVAVESGEQSKQSAITFNLVGHDIPAGSEVTRFVLTVAEGTEPGETPTVNPQERKLRACAAGSVWPSGQAETWDTRPDLSDECVTGTRRGDDTEVTWTFDLSGMAASWGEDPFANNGVVLTGAIPQGAGAGETWQVNLKAPSRDDPVTPMNEYEETSDRMVAEVAYVSGSTDQAPAPPVGDSGVSGLSGSSSSGTTGGTGLSTGGLSGGTSGVAGAPGANGDAPNPQLPTVAARPPFVPTVPPYVWALIPAALLATAAVRAALVEEAAITRPGGVIETIRGRNAARRGTPPTEPGGMLARLVTLLPFSQAGR